MVHLVLVALFAAFGIWLIIRGVNLGGSALPVAVVLAALCFLVVFLLLRRRGKKQVKPASPAKVQDQAAGSEPVKLDTPARQSSVQYHFVKFKVAGTTYKNDDGSDRQDILRHIKFKDAPYVTGDSMDVHIQPYEYEGKTAYKCLVNGYMIGNVPNDQVAEVSEAMQHDDAVVSGIDVTGGGIRNGEKIYYGCVIALRYAETLQNA